MRDRHFWRAGLARELRLAWPQGQGRWRPARMLEVELLLFLMENVAVGQPAIGGWTLITGYPFADNLSSEQLTDSQQRMIRIARHLLWPLRRRRLWERALQNYVAFDSELRGYKVSSVDDIPEREYPLLATSRWDVFATALSQPPPFVQRRRLDLAVPGDYRFASRKMWTSISLPETVSPPDAGGYDLAALPAGRGSPVKVSLRQLRGTAEWMDDRLTAWNRAHEGYTGPPLDEWITRTRRIGLERAWSGKTYADTNVLVVDGLFHLVGMVGAGKSTLRDVLAVWVARRGGRITLVVGDIAEQMATVELFRRMGLNAAPVLGSSTRERNVQRLHRRLAMKAPTLLAQDSASFDFLSTACPLDALRGVEAVRPLKYSDAPCVSLFPARPARKVVQEEDQGEFSIYENDQVDRHVDSADDEPDRDSRQGCPYWHGCPRHYAVRSLAEADIWVANPASLVHTPVPQHQNDAQIRFLELACRRSDLIVIDEVDRVQMQLDAMFAPSTTLAGRTPDSWLDVLHIHKVGELADQARIQLSDRDVERWSVALSIVTTATDRLYAMLVNQPDLCEWVGTEYFSAWTLQHNLTSGWYPVAKRRHEDLPADSKPADDAWRAAARDGVIALLDDFRDDPLGDGVEGTGTLSRLCGLANELLRTTREPDTYRKVGTALGDLRREVESRLGPAPWPQPGAESDTEPDAESGMEASVELADEEQETRRFVFTLLLAVLHHRLEQLTELWPRVEAALKLDENTSRLGRRPPDDYTPVIPESPMGNVLGFQFLRDESPSDDGGRRSGVLRFFRCSGVGRALLTELTNIPTIDGRAGPNVLMVSGTSWAGTAVGAHLKVPVGGILKPPEEELRAIRKTAFETLFIRDPHDPENRALHLSGKSPQLRRNALYQMLHYLARPSGTRKFSVFQEELSRIGDPDRRRILLLVGSYEEAEAAYSILQSFPIWRDRSCSLVPDDAELDNAPDVADRVGVLRRGDVSTFKDTGAEILIAPLLAMERGHNILNDAGDAAFGSVFFLARPHPRPHDISLAVQSLNCWVTEYAQTGLADLLTESGGQLDKAGLAFRHGARKFWNRLLTRRMSYRSLPDAEKEAFAWDRLVVIWQVVGRLVRGGVPARVVFVDAKFAEREANGKGRDTFETGLLAAMEHVLKPYMGAGKTKSEIDRKLVATLYDPLYEALCGRRPWERTTDEE